ncbi:diguanylate cyclase domain-containing protein [Pseudomonas gingeri]|uniref:Diguanylate cyclase n=1 Tax=Pseudomonas gingeri TaxID=117681 RepID=A0A7Y7Y9Y2_9PSED|nr:diguanylate cyclase [Pseudomonas gingeri]NWA03178.1 diguanylate cyclase [Pseudomonas gingeri]NWA18400.1 diguanylate cyclase [Pseudomonas gingeri]NWA53219.1 diguanylate cyclase [Pseudomonas gingeri]NWA98965.1 diguanylate cyclase [Pseudomonas gingeri]NWB02299.1 diguanylate cyclase [Pseudomonas gingeri]
MPVLPSLRSRFALLIALLVGLLSWLLGSFISHDSSVRMRGEIGQDLAEVSYQMSDRLDRAMANRIHLLSVISRLNVLQQASDLTQIRQLLDHLQEEFPDIAWLGMLDTRGQVRAATGGILQDTNISQRPVFSQGHERLFVGDVHDAVLLSKLLPNPSGETLKFVDISLPIFNGESGDARQKVGVLAAHLSWTWAEGMRQSVMAPIKARRNVEFFVVAADHRVLLGPRDSIGKLLELPLLEGLDKQQPRWGVQRWPDGNDYLTGFALSRGHDHYAGLGWAVITRQTLEEAYAPAKELQRDIVVWGIALAVIIAFIGWLLATWFTRPLQAIAKAADRLSVGESMEIPEIKGTREIAQLSQSIRHLVDSLSNQQTALGMMESLAHHDALTGLPNRAALEKYLPRAQQRSQSQNNCLALLYLDLDGFKPINDQFGHAGGDELLREVASRLRACLREGDMVARLGGDEFLMVLQVPRNDALNQARAIANRVLGSLGQSIMLHNVPARIGCSIGGAVWPLDNPDLSDVLGLADQALYRAKHAGKGQAHFHQSEEVSPGL